jgi:hypothetical protein
MREFGFAFDARAASAGTEEAIATRVKDFGHHGNKRRYGITDRKTAETYGYHLASVVTGVSRNAPNGTDDDRHGLGDMTTAKIEVLYGKKSDGTKLAKQVNGRDVPTGGCAEAATRKLTDLGDPRGADLVANIKRDSFLRAQQDPAVRAAFNKWSSCMKAQGYNYSDPGKAGNDLDTSTSNVTAREIAVAKADVDCKEKNDVVKAWVAFEVRYQDEEINKHAEELANIKSGNEKLMRNIAEAVGGA